MWHQKCLGHWWVNVINACSCRILSRTLRTGRKRSISLITGPQHSLVEEQKVQLFLLKSEANRLFEETALRVVDSSLTQILKGEGKLCCTLWHLWRLVVITGDQWISFRDYPSYMHRESYFACWWSRRQRSIRSKSKSLQVQTTGCVITKTDTQKKRLN